MPQLMAPTLAEIQAARTFVIDDASVLVPALGRYCLRNERIVVKAPDVAATRVQLTGKATEINHVRVRFEVHVSGQAVSTTKIASTSTADLTAALAAPETYFLELLPAEAA